MAKSSFLTLPCGARLAVAEMPWMESVSLGIFLNVGSRQDPEQQAGLAHFAEHLFFKGTKRRDARQLALEVESAGGNVDAFTSEEHTCFYVRGPAEGFAHFAEILLDMFLHSTFPEEEVERERDVISEEITMYHEQPTSRAEDLLCATMWPRHPLGRPIPGDQESLRRIKRRHLKAHARRYYGAANCVFAVAGRISAKEASRVLESMLARNLPCGEKVRNTKIRLPSSKAVPRIVTESRAIEQTQIALAFHGLGRDKGRPHVLKLLNVIAGECTSSRLWQQVREKRGWCYQIDSEALTLSDTGLFQVFSGVDPKNLVKALKVIWKELRQLVEKPVTAEELQRALAYTLGTSRLNLENTANQMMWIGESLLFYGEITTMAQAHRRLRSVTPAAIQQEARRLFRPHLTGLAIVGPEFNADLAHVFHD